MRECFSRKRQSHLHVEGLSRCYLSRLIGSDGGIHLIQNGILFRQRSLSWLLNQHEFANLLNKSFTSVCNWEQGNRIPKTETIKEIAEVLNVDYTYFKDQE